MTYNNSPDPQGPRPSRAAPQPSDSAGRSWVRVWAPVVAACAVIFLLSSIPGGSMPEGGFWRYDKLAHGLIYGVLSLLWYRAFCAALPPAGRSISWVRLRAAGLAIVAAGLYGLSDEWHQSFVPGRSDSGLDLLADVIGAAIFVAVAYLRGQSRQNSARS